MRLTTHDGTGEQEYELDPGGLTFSDLLQGGKVDSVLINGRFEPDWRNRIAQRSDIVVVRLEPTDPISFFVGLVVNLLLSVIATALTPTPRKPAQHKQQPALGVAGVTNTVAPGTPKFFVIGLRRIFPHLIASRVDQISERKLSFSVLYLCGPACEALTDIEVDESPIEDIEDWSYEVRLGTEGQTIMEGFEYVPQTYNPGLTLQRNEDHALPGDWVPYATRSALTDRVRFIFQFGGGFRKKDGSGVSYVIEMEQKLKSDPPENFVPCIGSPLVYTDKSSDPQFRTHEFDLTQSGKWSFRLRLQSVTKNTVTPDPVLLNVMETRFIQTAYPGDSLLKVSGLGASQIVTLDQLKVSVLQKGRILDEWDGATWVQQWSRKRAWAIWHLFANQEVGLGNVFDSTFLDEDSFLEAQEYWDEQIAGYSGDENRDYCDVIVNEVRPGWEYIKQILSEARGAIVPSQGKLKLVLDKPRVVRGNYQVGENALSSSWSITEGQEERAVNTLKGDFPDENENYKVQPFRLAGLLKGTDPERAEEHSYISITRESEIAREARIRVNRHELLNLRAQWRSHWQGMFSDPWDRVYFTVPTVEGDGGFGGTLTVNGTVNRVILSQQIELEDGANYEIVLQHAATNTVEEQIVSNAPGKWVAIVPSYPFKEQPKSGDTWFIGKTGQDRKDVAIEQIRMTELGHYEMRAVEYKETVYDQDDPLPRPTILDADEVSPAPLPLLYAQAKEMNPVDTDVDWQFDVVPMFGPLAGLAQGGSANSITLAAAEPAIDDLFIGAEVTANAETREVTDYTGSTKAAPVTPAWSTVPSASDPYRIEWMPSGQFGGFKVEKSSDPAGPWTEVGITNSTRLVIATQPQGSTEYFRFTPRSVAGIENESARWIVQLAAGDVTAPAAPTAVDAESEDKTVLVTVTIALPLERDAKAVEVRYLRDSLMGTEITTSEIPLTRDDTATGTKEVSTSAILSGESYGTSVCVQARTVDYVGNASAWTDGNCVTLTQST